MIPRAKSMAREGAAEVLAAPPGKEKKSIGEDWCEIRVKIVLTCKCTKVK
jgi:hypothetical protein